MKKIFCFLIVICMLLGCVACNQPQSGDKFNPDKPSELTKYMLPKEIAWFDTDNIVAVENLDSTGLMDVYHVYVTNAPLAKVLKYCKICKNAGFTYTGFDNATEPNNYTQGVLTWDGQYNFNDGTEYAISIAAYQHPVNWTDSQTYDMDILFACQSPNNQ